jgi:ankyrin repeat protein
VCEEGHEDIVELLLQNGANINTRNSQNCTALMIGNQRLGLNFFYFC